MSEGIIRLEIPKWGLSMEEGVVNCWLINEGDRFDVGAEIAEIESSKIANVLEAHKAGVLRRKLVAEGDSLPVGGLIGIATDSEVSDEDIDSYLEREATAPLSGSEESGSNTPAPSAAPPEPVSAEVSKTSDNTGAAPPVGKVTQGHSPSEHIVIPDSLSLGGDRVDSPAVSATRHAEKLAAKYNLDLSQIPGSGRRGRISVEDIRAAVVAAGGSLPRPERSHKRAASGASTADDSTVRATPLARKLALEKGINLRDVPLSDARGRVTKEAVLALLRSREQGHAVGTDTHRPDRPQEQARQEYQVLPFSATRRTIASRLQTSKQTSPHFRVSRDVRVDELLRLRSTLNAELPEARISINDFVVKACACALQQLPHCNVQFVDNEIRCFERVDIAVAVATQTGLVTPVVRDAGGKTLSQLSTEMRSLATRAKAGQLKIEEIEGGTFTVSNLGMYGVHNFDAIINPPQAAILAVGSTRREPVADDDQLSIGSLVNLTLSCDHRILDGAVAAELLGRLQYLLSEPALMVV